MINAIVYDNAPKYGGDKGISTWLPASGGKVLITSRYTTGWSQSLAVDVFTRAESQALIEKVLDRKLSDEDKASINSLAETLGDLPLALAQASAYIKKNKMKVSRYLELYKTKKEDRLKDKTLSESEGTLPADSKKAIVYITWDITMDDIRKESLLAANWLNSCAYLASNDIPDFLLETFAKDLENNPNSEIYDGTRGTLSSYSMLTIDEESQSASIHPLVQEVIQLKEKQSGSEKQANWKFLQATEKLLLKSYPSDNMMEDYAKKRQLLPHFEACLPHLNDWQRKISELSSESGKEIERDNISIFLDRMGDGYGSLGNAAKQRELLERALAINEKYYGPDHVEVAVTLGSLGNAYGSLGDAAKKRELLERALAINEKYYGPDHVEVAGTLTNLGTAYGDLGDAAKQRDLLERALAIQEKTYGPDHVEVAVTLTNLGDAYRALGNAAKACELLERALTIKEKTYGPDHVEVAGTLTNLGGAYRALGNAAKACELLERALAIQGKTYGPDHVEVAVTLGSLGTAYGSLGDAAKARELLERALRVFKRDLPPYHPYTQTTQKNLEIVNRYLQNNRETRPQPAQQSNLLIDELFNAVRQGDLQKIGDSIAKGVNVNDKDNFGVTPLHAAAQKGRVEVIKLLLKNGAHIDTIDGNEWTPLHDAALSNHLDAVNVLLAAGANINAANRDNQIPIYYTTDGSIKKVLQSTQALFSALRQKQGRSKIQALLNEGASVHAVFDTSRSTVLHFAAYNGDVEVIRALLEKNPNINAVDKENWTALHYAAQEGHLEAVQLLLDNQAELNIENEHKKTPLDLAEKYAEATLGTIKYLAIARLLRERGGKMSAELVTERVSRPTDPKDCLQLRKKRNVGEGCLFSWEDIDQFNEEKDEARAFDKITIGSDKFLRYIKDISEAKRSSLLQLADQVDVTGESHDQVYQLLDNEKVMRHLSRAGKIAGMTMQGMMAKNVLADFLNGDEQGVAINVGFIAGGQGFSKVAEAASLRGTTLAAEGKNLLGRSLKAASPFLARGTSAFVVYDLVNQIKTFENGTEEALVGVIGDSLYLGVDVAEIGIEIAEAFEVLEGVSSVPALVRWYLWVPIFIWPSSESSSWMRCCI